jgi:hypothetical protein
MALKSVQTSYSSECGPSVKWSGAHTPPKPTTLAVSTPFSILSIDGLEE